MTRRGFLKGLAGVILAGLFAALYGVFLEPMLRLRVRRWRLAPEGWTAGPLRIAVIADLHVGGPWVTRARVRRIVARTNALGADLALVLGDLEAGHPFVTRKVPLKGAAEELGRVQVPLGIHAVLGNHDWWHDARAQAGRVPLPEAGRALEAAGIPVLENAAVRLEGAEGPFWLAGLGDQLAYRRPGGFEGRDDLPGTLAQVTDEAPVILLAHEPDIFPQVPDRVCLTLSGHTHGGQVRLFGYSPVVPSAYGNRYAYGWVREGRRDLVVSGGIGCSILPVRFGMTPEITVIEIG